jgi:serine O-acetyltransferase
MVGPPARAVPRRGAGKEAEPAFMPYGLPADIPDPIARTLNGLLDEVTSLRARVAELESSGPGHGAETAEPPPLPHSNGAGKKERVS